MIEEEFETEEEFEEEERISKYAERQMTITGLREEIEELKIKEQGLVTALQCLDVEASNIQGTVDKFKVLGIRHKSEVEKLKTTVNVMRQVLVSLGGKITCPVVDLGKKYAKTN